MAALLSPSTLPGETNALHLLTARAALPQIIIFLITIYFYKITISIKKYATLNINININTKISKNSNLQLFIKYEITAGYTIVREVAALFNTTRITYKLNKDTFLKSNNAIFKNYSKLKLY